MTLRGLEQVKSKLENAAVIEAAQEGLTDVAREIYNESVNKYCPVDTGKLRGSCQMYKGGTKKGRFSILIGYSTEYAIYVHEIASNYHPHGSWKYLEIPFLIHIQTIEAKIRERIRGAI